MGGRTVRPRAEKVTHVPPVRDACTGPAENAKGVSDVPDSLRTARGTLRENGGQRKIGKANGQPHCSQPASSTVKEAPPPPPVVD